MLDRREIMSNEKNAIPAIDNQPVNVDQPNDVNGQPKGDQIKSEINGTGTPIPNDIDLTAQPDEAETKKAALEQELDEEEAVIESALAHHPLFVELTGNVGNVDSGFDSTTHLGYEVEQRLDDRPPPQQEGIVTTSTTITGPSVITANERSTLTEQNLDDRYHSNVDSNRNPALFQRLDIHQDNDVVIPIDLNLQVKNMGNPENISTIIVKGFGVGGLMLISNADDFFTPLALDGLGSPDFPQFNDFHINGESLLPPNVRLSHVKEINGEQVPVWIIENPADNSEPWNDLSLYGPLPKHFSDTMNLEIEVITIEVNSGESRSTIFNHEVLVEPVTDNGTLNPDNSSIEICEDTLHVIDVASLLLLQDQDGSEIPISISLSNIPVGVMVSFVTDEGEVEWVATAAENSIDIDLTLNPSRTFSIRAPENSNEDFSINVDIRYQDGIFDDMGNHISYGAEVKNVSGEVHFDVIGVADPLQGSLHSGEAPYVYDVDDESNVVHLSGITPVFSDDNDGSESIIYLFLLPPGAVLTSAPPNDEGVLNIIGMPSDFGNGVDDDENNVWLVDQQELVDNNGSIYLTYLGNTPLETAEIQAIPFLSREDDANLSFFEALAGASENNVKGMLFNLNEESLTSIEIQNLAANVNEGFEGEEYFIPKFIPVFDDVAPGTYQEDDGQTIPFTLIDEYSGQSLGGFNDTPNLLVRINLGFDSSSKIVLLDGNGDVVEDQQIIKDYTTIIAGNYAVIDIEAWNSYLDSNDGATLAFMAGEHRAYSPNDSFFGNFFFGIGFGFARTGSLNNGDDDEDNSPTISNAEISVSTIVVGPTGEVFIETSDSVGAPIEPINDPTEIETTTNGDALEDEGTDLTIQTSLIDRDLSEFYELYQVNIFEVLAGQIQLFELLILYMQGGLPDILLSNDNPLLEQLDLENLSDLNDFDFEEGYFPVGPLLFISTPKDVTITESNNISSLVLQIDDGDDMNNTYLVSLPFLFGGDSDDNDNPFNLSLSQSITLQAPVNMHGDIPVRIGVFTNDGGMTLDEIVYNYSTDPEIMPFFAHTTVYVNAVADKPLILDSPDDQDIDIPFVVNPGEAFNFSEYLPISLVDIDGSEHVGVRIDQLPEVMITNNLFSNAAGDPIGVFNPLDNSYVFTLEEYEQLLLTPPEGFTGELFENLRITVTTREGSNGDATKTELTFDLEVYEHENDIVLTVPDDIDVPETDFRISNPGTASGFSNVIIPLPGLALMIDGDSEEMLTDFTISLSGINPNVDARLFSPDATNGGNYDVNSQTWRPETGAGAPTLETQLSSLRLEVDSELFLNYQPGPITISVNATSNHGSVEESFTINIAGVAEELTLSPDLNGGDPDDFGFLIGGGANDTLTGSDNSDLLFGGDGNDIILGNNGNDIIYAGTGNNTISGGSGGDLFIFNTDDYFIFDSLTMPETSNTISDFNPADNDGILIRIGEELDFDSSNSEAHFEFNTNGGDTTLTYHPDGDGGAGGNSITMATFTGIEFSSSDTNVIYYQGPFLDF